MKNTPVQTSNPEPVDLNGLSSLPPLFAFQPLICLLVFSFLFSHLSVLALSHSILTVPRV